MTLNKNKNSLERAYRRFKDSFRLYLSPIMSRFRPWIESLRADATKPQVFAYQVIGERTIGFLPLFKDLDINLRKSGIRVNFKAYVSIVVLTTFLFSVSVLILVPVLLTFIFGLSLFSALLFGVGSSLLAGALTVIGFYFYPIYRASNLKRELEDDLPFTAGYMSILAGAGVLPDVIFRSLAQADASLAVSNEARTVVRDVELFGFDVISALEAASQRTPSEEFKELLEGFIATIHSGGSLVKYLRDRSRQYMKLKRIALRRFSDTLTVLAEFYVTLIVAGSLIFLVMLSVLAMLGGGGFGLLDSRLLLYLLTYFGLPIGSIVFLTILDIISPKR